MTVLFDSDDSLIHESTERGVVQEPAPNGFKESQPTSNINSSSVKDRYEICFNQSRK